MTTATKPTTITFGSVYEGLRLIRVQEDEEFLGRNQKRKLKGYSYQFENGTLELEEGEDVLPDGENGEEQDAVTWLRNHARFNSTEPGGFHEVPPVVPPAAETLMEIMRAQAAGELDRLVAIYDEEQAGHRRDDVLEAATIAMGAIEQQTAPGGATAPEAGSQASSDLPPAA